MNEVTSSRWPLLRPNFRLRPHRFRRCWNRSIRQMTIHWPN